MRTRRDLLGEKFGDLVVIEKMKSRKLEGNKSERRWKCRCTCGNEIELSTDRLMRGKSNCGCKNKIRDITGKKFGRLTVLRQEGIDKWGKRIWLCKCVCGNTKIVRTEALTSGDTKSCGCLLHETRQKTYSNLNKTHGMTNTRLYKKWRGIICRCYSEGTNGYKNYGGRGIKVCNEWKNDFMSFYEWAIATGYKQGLTIDRIDVNDDYKPDNCKWATIKEQQNNKRSNCFLEYEGEIKTLKQWSEKFNIKYATLKCRKDKGWNVQEILFGRKRR